MVQSEDFVALKTRADKAVDGAAEQLRGTLHELAAQLDPFPFFMGVSHIRAIETEPGRMASPDRGCIVVCPDGDLYEYKMQFKVDENSPFDNGPEREDEVKAIDLPPHEYIVYAYTAILELVKHLQVQRGRLR